MMGKTSLRVKIIFILLTIFLPILVVAGIGEIYLRLFSDYVTPEVVRNRNLQYEASIFSRHRFPRRELTTEDSAGIKWYINPKGYRGPDFPPEKPENVIRMIFYGGSFVFDTASRIGESRESWPHQVGGILRDQGMSDLEVINAGIPGHASYDSFGRLFAEGHNFNPDFVLICNAWNDIKDFQSEEYLLRRREPFLGKDYRVDYFSWLDRLLCRTSQLYCRLRDRYFSWKYEIGAEGIIPPEDKFTGEISDIALGQYRLTLEMFVDLSRNIGAVPVLMTQPRLPSPVSTEEQKRRISYRMVGFDHDKLVEAFEITDRIIRAVAEDKNAFLIDLAPEFTGVDEYFQDHVHLTNQGVDAFSEAVAREMQNILIVEGLWE